MSGQKKTPSGDVPDLVPNKKRSERAEVPYGGSPEPSCFMTSSMTRRVGRSVPKVGAERGRPADSVMTSSTAEDWAEYRRRSISAWSRLMTSFYCDLVIGGGKVQEKNAEKGRCHARPLPKGATRGVWWRSKGVRQCNDLAKELGQGVKYIVQASPFCTP